ncbi:MAG TPA: DUF6799 domain-containing protein [Ginsengibacter sp.]|nr:DUF6799 domain-containing protein [Ginsengibacter sp.]
MKKVLIAFFAVALTSGSFAQDSTNGMSNMSQVHTMQNADGVIMQNGKVLQRRSGQVSVLTQNLVLADGTIVSPEGTVKMKDGTTITMQEGDYFKMDGTKGNIKTDQNSMSNKTQTDTTK